MAQLYFYYSAMNAGKSTALLQSSYNYQERGMRTVVYTAEIDDRFGTGKISSRIGLSSPAKLFNQNTSLFEEIRAENARQTIHCVLVDESQFLTRQQVLSIIRGCRQIRYSGTLLWPTNRLSWGALCWQSILTVMVR
ncbi:thymidine kinase [Salmonella enterica subsp. arizonae]|uniref:Thymidine kinase n=1 Tax=Salmonella enterica subsp. arizonae TaxID=59203 RepID=A0A379SVV5_SALER|nr:thymidine kinase [Salmonella enterica subsp. arizonae]